MAEMKNKIHNSQTMAYSKIQKNNLELSAL